MKEVATLGRPPIPYSQEVAAEICVRVATSSLGMERIVSELRENPPIGADGQPLKVPSFRVAFNWLSSNTDFQQAYARAKELQADYLAEETLELADNATGDAILAYDKAGNPYAKMDGNSVRRAELMVKARQWAASKLNARRYGDKMDVTSGGEPLPALAPLAIDQRVQSILTLAAARRREEEEARRLLE